MENDVIVTAEIEETMNNIIIMVRGDVETFK